MAAGPPDLGTQSLHDQSALRPFPAHVLAERVRPPARARSGAGHLARHGRTYAELLGLATILLAAVGLRALNLDDSGAELDEGIRGMQLRLMSAGYRPFREIHASQGPLLLDLLYPLYLAFGGTLTAARLAVGAYSIVAIGGAYGIARQIAGPVGGCAAALLLVLSPAYLRNSRLALGEVVSLGPAALAIGALLAYRRSGRRPWLLAAVLLLGLSLLIKPITLAAVLPFGLFVLLRGRAAIRALTGPVLAAGLVGVLVVAALGFQPVFEEILGYRLRSREAEGWSLAGNLAILQEVLSRESAALFGLALLGGILALRRAGPGGLLTLAWAAGAVGLLFVYSPLAPKHVVTIVVPLAALAGCGIGLSWRLAREGADWRRPIAALSILVVVATAWSLPSAARAYGETLRPDRRSEPRFSDTADVVSTLAALTGPGDFVLTDHPPFALLADRLVPPPLVDPSRTRARAGELTRTEVAAAVADYPSSTAVLWRNRLSQVPGFRAWFDQRYRSVKLYGKGSADDGGVYLARQGSDFGRARATLTAGLSRRADADLAGELRLGAFEIPADELVRGGSAPLVTEWEATRNLSGEYLVTSSLVGPNGTVWAEDIPIPDRNESVRDWTAGRWVLHVATIKPPADVPVGRYSVRVAVRAGGARRPTPAPSAGGTPDRAAEVELATLEVR